MRVHVIHETDSFKGRPFGSSYIRLIRPLLHRSLHQKIKVSFGNDLLKGNYDCVVVERFWRPDLNLMHAEQLINSIRRTGASLVYTLDDNLLDLNEWEEGPIISPEKIHAVRLFIREADLVVVSTPNLSQRIKHFSKRTIVIQNAIDDDIFFGGFDVKSSKTTSSSRFLDCNKISIGFMGTHTHAEDIRFILEPIRSILSKYRNEVSFVVVRGTGNDKLNEALSSFNVGFIDPGIQTEYPNFIRWMRHFCNWDIGVAPLTKSPINLCKSDIKFLDYSALGIAGIYSNIGEYPETISDQAMGIIADQPEDWFTALDYLINNSKARDVIRNTTETYIKKNRTLSVCAINWYNALLAAVNT